MKVDIKQRVRGSHGVPGKIKPPNLQGNWISTDTVFRRTCLSAMLATCFDMAAANPTAPQVVAGQANFATQGNTLSVTNTPNTIINWNSFSINPGELTRFIQQNADSSVLNRITGQNPTRILGALQSNGKVFLINPNGILFGAGSRVDVNGLVASSLNLSNQDFLNGKLNFAHAAISGDVSNKGTITTPNGGRVFLIAPNVENSGIITSPNGQVMLAAGHSVQLVDSGNPDLQVVVSSPADQAINLGQIVSQAGKIGIYGALVRQRGVVNADSAVIGENGKVVFRASRDALLEAGSLTSANGAGSGGEIHVLGERVGLLGDARVDASGVHGGGSVLLGGDYQGKNPTLPNAQFAYVGAQASVRADALQQGDGGKVIVWSEQGTQVYGKLDAQGGLQGGNGGLVETSGKLRLDVDGAVIRAAARAAGAGNKNGQWLLDPADVTVVHGSSGSLTAGVFDPPSASSIGDTQINATLAGGTDVTIQTSGGTGGTGLIRVNGNGDANGAVEIVNRGGGTRSLTLTTSGAIDIRSGATLSGQSGQSPNPLSVALTGSSITVSGEIDNQGGNTVLAGATTLTGKISNGTLAASNTLTGVGTLDNVSIAGTLNLAGGMFVGGNLTLENGAVLNLGNSSLYFSESGNQHLATTGSGTINMAGGALYGGYNTNDQQVHVDSGVTLQGYGSITNSQSVGFRNSGSVIANTAGQTLNINPASFSNDGTLQVTAGSMTLAPGYWSGTGSIAVGSGGTLNLNFNTTTADLGTITRSGGTVNFNGVLDNANSVLDIGGGGVFGAGGLSSLGGTISHGAIKSGDSTPLSSSSGTLDSVLVLGTLGLSGGAFVQNDLSLGNGATLNLGNSNLYFKTTGSRHVNSGGSSTINLAGGAIYAGYSITGQTLEFGSGVTLQGYGSIAESSAATLINSGTIDASTNGKTFSLAATSFYNNGALQASSGTLSLSPLGWNNSGTMAVAGSGDLKLNFDTTTAGLGSVSRSGGTVYFNGVLENSTATLDIGGSGIFGAGGLTGLTGTIRHGTLLSGDSTVLNSSGGTLDAVTVSGTLGTSGSMSVKHDLTLADGAVLNLGASNVYFSHSGTTHVASAGNSTINLAGATLYAGYGVSGQTLYLDSGLTLQGYGGLYESSPAAVVNAGTINASTTGQTFNLLPGTFTNTGVLQASSGNLTIGHIGWNNSGSMCVGSSGVLTLGFDTTTAGLGSITRSGGSVNYNGVLDNSGQTLDIGGSGPFGAGGLTHLGGTIRQGTLKSGDSTVLAANGKLDAVTVSGTLATSGSLEVMNGITLADGTSLNLGNSSVYFENTGTQHLATAGTASVNMAGATLYAGYGSTGQTLQIDSGVTLQGHGYLGESQAATVVNYGTIRANNPSQVLTLQPGNFTNHGTLEAAGLLYVGHIGWSNPGSLVVGAGGTLNAYMDTTTAGLGSISRSGGTVNYHGVLDNTGATLDIGGSGIFGSGGLSSLTGTIRNGTVQSSDSTPLSTSSASLDNVTLSGNLSVGGSAFIKNGLTLASGAVVNMGSSNWYFSTGGTQHIASGGGATLNLAGANLVAGYGVNGQTLVIDNGVTLAGYGGVYQSSVATVENAGVIDANVTGQTFSVLPGTLHNTGTLRASNGILTLDPGNWLNSGSMQTAGSGVLNLNFDTTTAGLGSVTRSGGSVKFNGTLDNTSASLDIGNAGPFGSGGLTALGGSIINGTLVSSDSTPLAMPAGAVLDGVTLAGNLDLSGSASIKNHLHLADGATLNLGNTYFYFTGSGTQHIATAGTATANLQGGVWYGGYGVSGQTLQIDSGVTLQGYGYLAQSSSTGLLNNGALIANTGGQTLSAGFASITNNGSLRANAGTLQLTGLASNDGLLHVASGAVVSTGSTALTNNAGGTVSGSGLLSVGSATFTNNGTLQPGGAGTVGTLSVSGNFVQGASGNIAFEVGPDATTHDVLAVTGSANLNGTLNVTPVASYTPLNNEQYGLLSYSGKVAGTFATINAPAFAGAAPDYDGAGTFFLRMPNGAVINIWNYDGSGNWNDPGKWSLGHVPTVLEDVQVPDYTSQFTLSIAANAQLAKSVVFAGNDRLAVSGGSLSVTNNSNLSAGTLDLSGSGIFNSGGNLNLKALNLAGSSAINLGTGSTLSVFDHNQTGGTITGIANVVVVNSFTRSGGGFANNLSGLDITQTSGSLDPGSVAIAGSVRLQANNGNISLSQPVASANGSISVDASQGAIVASGGGLNAAQLVLRARDGIDGTTPLPVLTSTLQALNSGNGDIRITNGASALALDDITSSGYAVRQQGSGAIRINSSGAGLLAVNAPLQTVSGDIQLIAPAIALANSSSARLDAGDGSVLLRASGAGGIVLPAASQIKINGSGVSSTRVELEADSLILGGTISTGLINGTGYVNIAPVSSVPLVIESGRGSGHLSVSPTELGHVSGSGLALTNYNGNTGVTFADPVSLSGVQNLQVFSNGPVVVNAPLAVSGANGYLNLVPTNSSLVLGSGGTLAAGLITVQEAHAIDLASAATASVGSNGGNLSLQADHLRLGSNAPLNVGSGAVKIFPSTDGLPVSVVSSPNINNAALELSGAELSGIVAHALKLGSGSGQHGSGTLSVNVALTTDASVSDLILQAGCTNGINCAGVTQTSAGVISAPNLLLDAAQGVSLNAASNQVSNLAADIGVNASGVLFANGKSLNIGVGGHGISAGNQPVGLNVTAGNLTLNQAINAGAVQLTASGSIGGSGSVNASSLAASSGNGIALSGSVNTLSASNSGGSANIDIVNHGNLLLNTVQLQGSGSVHVENHGPMTVAGPVSSGAGAILLETHSPLTIDGSVTSSGGGSITLRAGSSNSNTDTLSINSGATVTSSGSVSLQAGSSITVAQGSTVSPQAQQQPGQNTSLPTLNSCISNPALARCNEVLPHLSTCISAPATAGCSVVLPTIATCTSAPATSGCSVVLPTLPTCTTAPATPGCSVVLPTLAACTSSPATPGCSAVLPSLATCTTTPAMPGCSVVLPTLASCTVTPGLPGCSAVLPTLSACVSAPATAGCSAVLPTLSACVSAPATPGCSVILPALSACVSAPATPGCSVVLPSIASCTSTPELPGCSVVLPPLATCVSAPATPGCSAVLPNILTCTASPSAPGCSAVLPTLASCIAAPATAGCSAVLPSLANCTTTPGLPGCSVVLPNLAACILAPATPGCSVVLPSIAACISHPQAEGCSAVLPNLAACISNPQAPGCNVVLPDLANCISHPQAEGCTAVLPNLASCISHPQAEGCTVVLPNLAACISHPQADGCTVVLPNLATCISNPQAPGCSAVLPNLATCISTPAAAGCSAVLPTLAACSVTPTLPGCSVVLPNIGDCLANPAGSGCQVVVTPGGNGNTVELNQALNNTVDIVTNTLPATQPVTLAVLTPPAAADKPAAATPAGSDKPLDGSTSAARTGESKDDAKKDEKKDDSVKLAAKPETKKEEPVRKLYCN